MSTEESGEIEPRSERWERAQQSVHWREIGISAVAAAARYAANKTVATTPPPAVPTLNVDDTPPKVVTLRDIEFFAA
ncbi:hypothetical protein MKI84_16950 [Ancylobacter sp. A5.8]|uniref:hypothetical protein n=1 Tax=Ancylobacter gelatini TaxID=2919920 RepID=UPI001F4EDB5B|nr:hypothetical protein [Ancylobacter gelatini]MCJ8144615.1 hypothetical protein [Ancylobacter gelatini]